MAYMCKLQAKPCRHQCHIACYCKYKHGDKPANYPVPVTLYTSWLSRIWDMPARNVYGAIYYEFVVSHLSLYR